MPYSSENLSENYTPLVSGTHNFAYNKVVAIGIIVSTGNWTTAADWNALDANGVADKVKIIKNVIGSYDGGAPSTKPGYGNTLEIIDDIVHTLTARFEYNAVNRSFVEAAMFDRNLGIAFFTGDYEEFNVVNYPVSFTNKAAVSEELNKVREFEIVAKWSKLEFTKVLAVEPSVVTLFKP